MIRTNQVPDLTVAILAGSQSARFDGKDKGLLKLGSRTFIETMLHQLGPQAENLLISANRHHEIYSRYGHPVINDSMPDFEGPIAGVCAC